MVGLSADEAKAQGIEAKVAPFPFAANGRATSLESSDGFVRVVARSSDHRILGWQAVGVQVSELSIASAGPSHARATCDVRSLSAHVDADDAAHAAPWQAS